MSSAAASASAPAEVARLARRRGITAIVVAAVLAGMAVFAIAVGPWSPAFPVAGVVLAVHAVLTAVVGSVALSVAGRYPAVGHLGGIVDLAWLAAIAAAVGGIVALVALSVNVGTLLGIGVLLAGTAFIVGMFARAERAVVRSADATLPQR